MLCVIQQNIIDTQTTPYVQPRILTRQRLTAGRRPPRPPRSRHCHQISHNLETLSRDNPYETLLTTDFSRLRMMGWPFSGRPTTGSWAHSLAAHPDSRPARVVEQHRTGYVVSDDRSDAFLVESLPDWQRPRLPPDQRPAVGDWLLISGEAHRNARAVALLKRRTTLKRAAAGEHYAQQLIAANVDIVFVVAGLDNDFNARRIERYLLLIRGGAQPVVVLTKADNTGDDGQIAQTAIDALAALEVPVLTVDATQADSVAQLSRWLVPGTTAVVVGSSGAGKSTLTNTLLGQQRMKTAAVRATDDRGRHTTTHRALIPLPGGACLIDTPGMRELKPTGEETLDDGSFADIAELASRCRFRNCQHVREPGCAVQQAISEDELDAGRVANYLKLVAEVSNAADRQAARQAPRPGARKISKAEQRRLDQRHGKE